MADFIAGEGHRWWLDPNRCPHYNENVCEGFDGYYAATYESCPWRKAVSDDDLGDELRPGEHQTLAWEDVLSPGPDGGDWG